MESRQRVAGPLLRLATASTAARTWDLAPWAYALALAWWASSWNLRHSVLMAWSPVSPVWIGAVAIALCVVHRLGHPLRVGWAQIAPALLLVVCFLPGALMSSSEGYGPVKLRTMALVLLPVLAAALILLDSHAARRCWLWAQVVVGLAVTLAALEFHDTTHSVEHGRFALQTLDTITTARFVGVAVVGLLLLGLGSVRHAWWTLPLAAGGGMVLVHVGSRGPLLAALVAVLLVVASARCFVGRRTMLLVVGLVIGAAAFRYALADGGSGGRRIIESLESGLSDTTRVHLLTDAFHLGMAHPLGIGWGDFAQESPAGREIANHQDVAYAHNAFAEAFSEGGVLALLGLLVVTVVALWRLQRVTSERHDAVLLGIVLYWLLNAQVSSDFVGNRFLWICLACGLAASLPVRRSRGEGVHVWSRAGRFSGT